MIIRRKHWPLLIVLGIVGPVLGLAVGFFGWPGCPGTGDREAESAQGHLEAERQQAQDKPHVKLPNDRESKLTLEELAPGRPVALIVMKDIHCPVCQDQLVELTRRLDQVQRTGGAVFGMSTAEPSDNQRLMNSRHLGFPVLSDADRALHEQWRLWDEDRGHAIPGVVFLDEEGSLTDIHRGRYPGQPQEGMILDRLQEM